MEGLVFRLMQKEDEARMRAFYASLGEEGAAFFNLNRGNERRTMDFFGDSPRKAHEYYVAEVNGTAAGHLFIWDTDTTIPWVGLAVRDDFRRRGVGGFMLASLFDLLQARGYGGVLLRTAKENLPARGLYEKYGFEPLGAHPSGEILYLKRFTADDKRE